MKGLERNSARKAAGSQRPRIWHLALGTSFPQTNVSTNFLLSQQEPLSVFLKEWFSSHCIRMVPLGLLKSQIQNIHDAQKIGSTGCL